MDGAGETPTVFSLLSIVARGYGGLTRSVLQRASMLVDHGPVTLLVRNYLHDTHETLAASVERGILDPRVGVRCFWEEASPSGDGGAERPLGELAAGTYETVTEGESTRHVVRRGGRVSLERELDAHGRVAVVRRYDGSGRLSFVDEYDPRGRQITETSYDVDRNVPLLTHYLDQDGSTWLTLVVDPDDSAVGKGRLVDASTPSGFRSLSSRGAAQALWIDRVLAEHARPVLFVDSRSGDHVALRLREERARIVATGHNNHLRIPPDPDFPYKRTWGQLIPRAHQFDAVVLLTDEQRLDMEPLLDPRAVVRVIPHPAQPPQVRTVPVPRARRTAVCLARFFGQKRLDHAIEAFALVVKVLPDARFDLYGQGPDEEALQALIKARGLEDNVVIRGHTSDPEGVLRGASCLLMSSKFEGLPLVLFEALSVGTPVVSYDLKYGPRAVVRDGIDGLLAPDGDIQALAAALVRVLGDDELRASMIEAAPEVLDRFPRSTWERQWLDLVHEVSDAAPRDRSAAQGTGSLMPAVSVVIPVGGEDPHLRAAAVAALKQVYAGPLEVVLAAPPSPSGSLDVARALAKNPRVRLVEGGAGDQAASLSVAAATSNDPVVIRIDADVVLPQGFVRTAVQRLEDSGADAVVGRLAAVGTTPFERAVAFATSSRTRSAGTPADRGVYRRTSLERVGGYDEPVRVDADRELLERLRAAGTVVVDPALAVVYRPRSDLGALSRQYRAAGRRRSIIVGADRGSLGRSFVAPAIVLALVVLGVLGGVVGTATGRLWLVAGFVPLLGYGVWLVTAALRVPRSSGLKARPWVPAVFPTIHASWGWGFLTSFVPGVGHGR